MFLAACVLTVFAFGVNAQSVGINATGDAPNGSAMLDVSSTSKGFLPPRMTTAQRNLIPTPVEGLVIYNTDEKTLNIYNGTSWGFIFPLFCGQTFSDPRDGKNYSTVQIGTQCWMAQNLAYLPSVTDLTTLASDTDPFYYVNGYDGNNVDDAKATSNYQTYGALYNWPAAVAACPTGWHLPTDAEWTTLTTFLGDADFAGTAMKEAGFAHWIEDPGMGSPGTNSSGFTGLPGSYRHHWGTFQELGREGFFWSSTEESLTTARIRILNQSSMVGNNPDTKAFGFSVRCVR